MRNVLLVFLVFFNGCALLQKAPDSVVSSHENEKAALEAGLADAEDLIHALIADLSDAWFFQRELSAKYTVLAEQLKGDPATTKSVSFILEMVMSKMGGARAEDSASLDRYRRRWDDVKGANFKDWAEAHSTTEKWLRKKGLGKEDEARLMKLAEMGAKRLKDRNDAKTRRREEEARKREKE